MITIRTSERHRHMINVIKRYNPDFKVSTFFKQKLIEEYEKILSKVGVDGVNFLKIS